MFLLGRGIGKGLLGGGLDCRIFTCSLGGIDWVVDGS